MHLHTVLFAAVVLSLGCGPEATQTSEREDVKVATGELKAPRGKLPAAPTYALKTTDAHIVGTTPVWKSSFPISSTYDVYFSTEIVGTLAGHHTETIFVNMPGGSTYQRFDVAFATDVAAGSGEQQAEKTATGWRVWVSMPVAGTMIQQFNLAGSWTADTFVDAASTATARGTFSLY